MKDFSELYSKAQAAGVLAASGAKVAPMVVYEADVLSGQPVAGGKSWFVEDGVCGFAWVNVKPGNCAFANWLKAKGYGRADSYAGGVCIWISDYNQSLQRKEAHAHAMAKVLSDAGIKAYAGSRMD